MFPESGCSLRKTREFGVAMYILLYLKWITNKDPPHSTGKSALSVI